MLVYQRVIQGCIEAIIIHPYGLMAYKTSINGKVRDVSPLNCQTMLWELQDPKMEGTLPHFWTYLLDHFPKFRPSIW